MCNIIYEYVNAEGFAHIYRVFEMHTYCVARRLNWPSELLCCSIMILPSIVGIVDKSIGLIDLNVCGEVLRHISLHRGCGDNKGNRNC